jgi:threonine synthase
MRKTLMAPVPLSFVCTGCGAAVPAVELGAAGFRCPNAGCGDVDHVLRVAPVEGPSGAGAGRRPAEPAGGESPESNPFLRYRRRLTAWRLGAAAGLSDHELVEIVRALDAAVAALDGRGFHVTPFERAGRLSTSLGFDASGGVWVKDETGNVSGSHKGRHLMGVMLYLQVLERLEAVPGAAARAAAPDQAAPAPARGAGTAARTGAGSAAGGAAAAGRPRAAGCDERPRLAIASCGNAALAAAVIARAAGRALDVFVPPTAPRPVVDRLHWLGARQIVCERVPGEAGDPCYLRFREAVARGALGFCCQGPDNSLTIEGGQTIAWEMLDGLAGRELDRVFVQVGGGALASACALALLEEGRAGRLSRLPRLHAVQTAGGFPLARAWARVALAALEAAPAAGRSPSPAGGAGSHQEAASPAIDLARARAALAAYADARGDDESAARALAADHLALESVAAWLVRPAWAAAAGAALRDARRHRSRVMWTWEREPRSIARGILDDETYDWAAVVEGMLHTGGWPIVVSDAVLEEANDLAVRTTGIPVDHTGSAGLAGLAALRRAAPGAVGSGERVAVIFSGLRRT